MLNNNNKNNIFYVVPTNTAVLDILKQLCKIKEVFS